MDTPDLTIITYRPQDEPAVLQLWEDCKLTRPWNNPKRDIERILQVYPELFLVGFIGEILVATVIGGYDGHRGWIYYLGVLPDYRWRGYGRMMMEAVTEKLRNMGCPKINVQIRSDNTRALGFYRNLGYTNEDVISLARRLVEDE